MSDNTNATKPLKCDWDICDRPFKMAFGALQLCTLHYHQVEAASRWYNKVHSHIKKSLQAKKTLAE